MRALSGYLFLFGLSHTPPMKWENNPNLAAQASRPQQGRWSAAATNQESLCRRLPICNTPNLMEVLAIFHRR